MLRLHGLAAAYFTDRLEGGEGLTARRYLEQRGIGNGIVREFRLGYALPGWNHLRDYLVRKKIPLPLAEQAGLLARNERGDYYDRFRGRLIFPIEDQSGQIIAFGGRIIGEGTPKYLNSPESVLFSKGKNLYGLSRARDEIRKSGHVILVEGYFDLLALWNAGIGNVVATLGTALTREHVELLRRYTRQAAIVFDADEAGNKALARSLSLFVEGGLHMRAVMLPDGADPDDFVGKSGREKFLALVEGAPPAVEYYLDNFIGDVKSLESGRDALREAMAFIAKMENEAERNLFIKRVAQRIGLDEDVLKAELNRGRSKRTTTTGKESGGKTTAVPVPDALEVTFIALILDHPEKIPAMMSLDALRYFQNDELRKLGEEAAASYERQGRIDLGKFVDRLAQRSLREEILGRVVDSVSWDGETLDRVCRDTVRQIKRKWFKEKRRSLNMLLVRAQQAMDTESCQRLLAEKAELVKYEQSMLLQG